MQNAIVNGPTRPGFPEILIHLKEANNLFHNTACRLDSIIFTVTGARNQTFDEYMKMQEVNQERSPGLYPDFVEEIRQLLILRDNIEAMANQIESFVC